jgi:hypothetical protein
LFLAAAAPEAQQLFLLGHTAQKASCGFLPLTSIVSAVQKVYLER